MKLIKNKWYKSELGNYYKFDKEENGWFYYSERICNEIWEGMGFFWGWLEEMGRLLEDLSEIQEYLPDNHLDKIKPSVNQDYSYLTDFLNQFK